MIPRTASALCIALMAGISLLAVPSSSPAAATGTIELLPPPPTTKTLEIDGRFVTVTLSVTTLIPGIPFEGGQGVKTTASVRLSIQDGAPQPEGLKATRLRLEKLRGKSRVFHVPLTEVDASSGGFELDVSAFDGDITSKVGNANRLRGTVRIEYKGRVYRVLMGVVPVITEGPFP